MTSTDSTEQETFVSLFFIKDDYSKNVNKVANVTTHVITFVKRKEFASVPYKIELYPMSECSSITYRIKWAIGSTLWGAFLLLIFCFIIWGIFFSDTGIEAGTRIPVIGVFCILPAYAIRLLVGGKRHMITFKVGTKTVKWTSRGGEFKEKLHDAKQLVDFAKRTGRLDVIANPDAELLSQLPA